MVEIKKIVEQNKWWVLGKDFEYFDEDMKKFKEKIVIVERKDLEIRTGNVYTIEGPRQIGKTTWIKQKIKKLIESGFDPNKICYFSLDRVYSRKELSKILDYFISTKGENIFIFLDEIGYVKDWEIEIKSFLDRNLSKVCIVITGSPFRMREKISELIGRGIEGNRYFIKPLSFRDFLLNFSSGGYLLDYLFKTVKKINEETFLKTKKLVETLKKNKIVFNDLNEIEEKVKSLLDFVEILDFWFYNYYLITGGFPEIIDEFIKRDAIPPEKYEKFANALFTGMEFETKIDIRKLIEKLPYFIAYRVNLVNLTNEFEEGTSFQTLQKYLRILEDKFIIRVLNSVNKKLKERSRGLKKIYFTDVVMLYTSILLSEGKFGNAFEYIKNEILTNENYLGKIIENLVAISLVDFIEEPFIDYKKFLFFLYDGNKEIDFILKKDNKVFAIECMSEDIPKINAESILILTKDNFEIKNNIIKVPVSVFLSLIEKSKVNI
ncbi:MAG: AAA family ATPase [Candidatus Aenigmatarchaeota archaeon]